MRPRTWIRAGVWLLACLPCGEAVAQQPTSVDKPRAASQAEMTPAVDAAEERRQREFGLKAAFLWNAVRYVTWPTTAFVDASTAYTIGIIGRDPFGQALEVTLKDKKVGDRGFAVQRYAKWSELSAKQRDDLLACHLLWIAEATDAELAAIVRATTGRAILLVSDRGAFLAAGGTVAVYISQNKLGFQVDSEALKRQGLKASANLLKLSKANTDEGEGKR